MTIKDAILTSLDELKKPSTYLEVYQHIVKNNLCEFKGETPSSTVSASLGEFIRNNDSRVKREKRAGGTYAYYLTKHEDSIGLELLTTAAQETQKSKNIESIKQYDERDLHVLLSTYLKSTQIYAKTIFHEQSIYSKDSNQIWTHPDMIGVRFMKLNHKTSRSLLKSLKREDTIKISSYELKKEINNDNELKKAYFQAVSNSSWANFGYLVALEFNSGIEDEMERLNQSFGIGIIKLAAYPFESTILFPAKYRELDFKTIDKLCLINTEFAKFMEQIDKWMSADERFINAIEKELEENCDNYLKDELEIENYCKSKKIPQKE